MFDVHRFIVSSFHRCVRLIEFVYLTYLRMEISPNWLGRRRTLHTCLTHNYDGGCISECDSEGPGSTPGNHPKGYRMQTWFVSITLNFLFVDENGSAEAHQKMFLELGCTSIYESAGTSEIIWYTPNKPDAYSATSSCVRKLHSFLDADGKKYIIKITAMPEQERIELMEKSF